MKGIITKSTGSWYNVRKENRVEIRCRIKGKIRLDDLKHTNPVAVGDVIHFEMEDGRDDGVITKIEPRRNYIIRKSSNLSKQTHIIASNLDQAILIATLVEPKTSLGFIDRFLLTTEAYHIPAIIIFNKSDLCGGGLKEILDDTISIYKDIGYQSILCSAKKKTNIDLVSDLLKDKTSLIIGHSGVGKTSLLNLIEPSLKLKTSEISNYSRKGKHTTTFAEMFELSKGGHIIDTPGIKEFGVVDFSSEEISHYFKEMQPLIGQCKFNNCIHINEPECAVKSAVLKGTIREERYESYLSILNNKDIFE
jgi:ribosome biogenesis GTPase / thiamine phosphate phosphatase